MRDDFTGNQPGIVLRQRPFTADEVVLVYPLPAAGLEFLAQEITVGEVDEELPRRLQQSPKLGQYGDVVFRRLEIAETVTRQVDQVEGVVAETKFARIAFPESCGIAMLARDTPGARDQVMRPIDPVQVSETASRQLEQVPALAAAQVEYAGALLDVNELEKCIDLAFRDIRVLDDDPRPDR
jgi:hypothetical protein